LLQLCRRERVAIWHGHDYKSNVLGLLLSRFWPMRLVTTVHGWVQETPRLLLYYGIDRFCLPRYESVLCVSPDLVGRCCEAGVPAERCLLLENGIDTDEYRRRGTVAEAKCRLGLHPGRLAIGAVGRLSPEKGFDLLIRAVNRLVTDGCNVQLVIAGEGDQQPVLEQLIAHLGQGERIRLLGYCADPRALYEALDVFALSSRREGLPNVLLEALAYELPSVATNIAGVPRLIRDGENGLLVDADDVEAFTQSLARLLEDGGLRERLGRAGRHKVEADFSFAKRMQKIAALYDELLARERTGQTGRRKPPRKALHAECSAGEFTSPPSPVTRRTHDGFRPVSTCALDLRCDGLGIAAEAARLGTVAP
jgi:glycosyltransferase involved in cell wall biosynthesis